MAAVEDVEASVCEDDGLSASLPSANFFGGVGPCGGDETDGRHFGLPRFEEFFLFDGIGADAGNGDAAGGVGKA